MKSGTAMMLIGLIWAGSLIATGFACQHYRQQAAELRAEKNAADLAATALLDDMTQRRDQLQQRLEKLHSEQEKRDEQAQLEIARLAGELEHRPVRVRIVPAPGTTCGAGRSGTGSTGPAGAGHRAADPAQAHGLLPDANTQRLAAVIAEAETINAAYASCRARLLAQGGAL